MANQVSGLLSPWLQQRRLKAVRLHICGQVLDVGCNEGVLAGEVASDCYQGFDINEVALTVAAERYPESHFAMTLADCKCPKDGFDTVVMMAVLEHMEDPLEFFLRVRPLMARQGKIVLTTPAPGYAWILKCGAGMGIFSSEAQAEHQPLLGKMELAELGKHAGLVMSKYKRFLFGANQLVIYRKYGVL